MDNPHIENGLVATIGERKFYAEVILRDGTFVIDEP